MSRNGNGTYNLPAGNPVVTGTTISSTWANNTLADMANAITGSIAADGQTPITGGLKGTNGTVAFAGVGQTKIPSGTTAQRASSPTDGMIRYNTDLQQYEGYKNGAWSIFGNGAGGTLFSDTVTATQGQTVITMPTGYVLGGDNLSVYVNGSRQIYNVNYTETTTTSFTFATGLNVGDLVNYTIGASTSLSVNAASVLYNEGSTGAVDRNVEVKLQESVSVLDFGADSTGTTDSTAAFQAAIATGKAIFVPEGDYLIDSPIALEASPVSKLYLYGASETHNGVVDAKTQINLVNNTQYFVAMGYDSCIKNISFVGGVDVIHHTSAGGDANTTKLIDVCALNWTGTFFKAFGAVNGSHITWERPVFVTLSTSSVVWDEYTNFPTGGFDNLYINDGWIETASTVGFKITTGIFVVDNTRFVPYTSANSLWLDFYQPSSFSAKSTFFGGESGRNIAKWRTDGGNLLFSACELFGFTSNNYGLQLLGAPQSITLQNCNGTSNPSSFLYIDPAMPSASQSLLSACKFSTTGIFDNGLGQNLADATNGLAIGLIAKDNLPYVVNNVLYSNLIATAGYQDQSSGSGTGFTVLQGSSAPDLKGANNYGYQITATSNCTGNFFVNNGPGISTLSNGTNTAEMLVSVLGGSCVFTMAFCGYFKTFYLGPGNHNLCFPIYLVGATPSLGFSFSMTNGTVLSVNRMMVFNLFYNSRTFETYGSAAPTNVTFGWERGSVVLNSVPTVGQPKGWICTTAGKPGTWTSMGNL